MRTAFIASFVANVLLTLGSLAVLPERVAIHFGARGVADSWAAKEANAALLVGTHVFLFALLALSGRLATALPARWVNIPHRDYWLSAANRALAGSMVQAYTMRLGTALFALFMGLGVLTVRANLSEPVRLELGLFLPMLVLFLLYTTWWVVGFYRVFRVPES